jgi:hypothetical protein
MAIKFASPQDVNFNFISSKDEAVRCSNEDYAKYLESLDEQVLDLNPDIPATRFVLSLSSKIKDVLSAKDSLAGIAMKAQSTGEMPIYSLMFSQVRVAIKDIITNGSSEMKKGQDGLVADEIMLSLASSDILPEIFTALQNKQKSFGDVAMLKKS